MWSLSSTIRLNACTLMQQSTRQFSCLNKPSTPLSIVGSKNVHLANSSFSNRIWPTAETNQVNSPMQSIFGFMQRRFKSRGNTYQPSTLKRKRTFGFLARLRSRNGRKLLARRKAKGRWYLTH